MNDIELIMQYLDGALDAAAVQDFEQRLQHDPAFAGTFRLYQSVTNEMQVSEEEAALKTALAALSEKHFAAAPQQNHTPVRQLIRKWWPAAAAACLLIALFIVKPWQSRPLPLAEIYQRHAVPVELPMATRGNAMDSLERTAALHYNNKNYSTALPLLQQLLQTDTANAQWKMALYTCYLETAAYDKAMPGFKELAAGNSIFRYDARIWQALVLLRQQKKEECIRVLKEIPAGTRAGEEAQQMLKELSGD